MPLHIDYRPADLDNLIGNDGIKDSLRSIFGREKDRPHAYLLTGPSGSGKTTTGRIIASMLKCSEFDFREYNSSNTRGIDTIREISQNAFYAPTDGDVKAYLLDECFVGNTPIATPIGNTLIKDIQEGDIVYNLEGKKRVKHKFKNKVGLDRVIRICMSDGTFIFTTKQHLFFTDSGWKEAHYLTRNDLIFSFNCDSMYNNKYLLKEKMQYEREKMSRVFANIYSKTQKQKHLLQSKMCSGKKKNKKDRYQELRMVWERNRSDSFSENTKAFLFPKLCFLLSSEYASHTGDFSFRGASKNNEGFSKEHGSSCKKEISRSFLCSYEKEQPLEKSYYCSKTNCYEKNQWNSCSKDTRREWNRPFSFRNVFIDCIRKFMGVQYNSKNISGQSERTTKSIRISDMLQNRHRKFIFENRNRSRWMESFFAWTKRTGREEGETPKRLRVENIEIYQRGSNDKSFEGVIGDKERNQGFVEFYDLEIDGHPSYYANGVLVHNCHMLTKDAQNAILKVLEDCPSHVYFILCTTEPEKLLKTIHTRCTTYQVKLLADAEIGTLIDRVLKNEGISDFSNAVRKEIIRVAEGCPRSALVVLDQVIDILDEKKALAAVIDATIGEAEVIEICRDVMKNVSWKELKKKVGAVLKTTEPEKLRYAILGYLSAVLLDANNFSKPADMSRASVLIDIFSENTYSSGKAGIINMLFLSVK